MGRNDQKFYDRHSLQKGVIQKFKQNKTVQVLFFLTYRKNIP